MGKKKHEKGAGSTPATVQLEQAGIPFKTYEYAHSNDHMDDGYGVEAATKLGFDEHQVFKNAYGRHRLRTCGGRGSSKRAHGSEGAGRSSRSQESRYGRSKKSPCANPGMWWEASHHSVNVRITKPCSTKARCNMAKYYCREVNAAFRSASIPMICSRCLTA